MWHDAARSAQDHMEALDQAAQQHAHALEQGAQGHDQAREQGAQAAALAPSPSDNGAGA